jgi:hypothetical protein
LHVDARQQLALRQPGPIKPGLATAFSDLINWICSQGSRHAILEHFKSRFAAAAGVPDHRSSNESWAATDLDRIMDEAAANAPLFIKAFYDACHELGLRNEGILARQFEPSTTRSGGSRNRTSLCQ